MTSPSPAAAVTLPPLPAPMDRLWHVLLDLASVLRVPWTLLGGQMQVGDQLVPVAVTGRSESGLPSHWL